MDNKQQPEEILKLIQSESIDIEGQDGVKHAYLLIDDVYKICLDLVKPAPTPEAPDKIPSALQFIKRIAPLSETFTLKGVETMMESYALLREQRAVEETKNQWAKDRNLYEEEIKYKSEQLSSNRQRFSDLEKENNEAVEQAKEEWRKGKKYNPLITCNHCGDYYGVNIDYKCFKCLNPLF